MKRKILWLLCVLSFVFFGTELSAQNEAEKSVRSIVLPKLPVGVAEWNPEGVGNHRAVVRVERAAELCWTRVAWRRIDEMVPLRGIEVVLAKTGERIGNALVIESNKEYGDNKKAMYWYEKAAEQGSASAQYELGNFYYRGAGVSQSYEKAMYWYEKAAEKNNAEAQYMLGAFYAMGIGVPQNDETAEMWLKKAKENGYYGRCTLQAVKAAFYKPKSRAETERVLKDYYSNE